MPVPINSNQASLNPVNSSQPSLNPVIVQELCESRGGRHWAVRPNEPSGFRGCKDLLHRASALVTTCP